jgi:hypothetical protein
MQALYTDGWDILTFGVQFKQSVDSFIHLGKRLKGLYESGKLSWRDMGNPISEAAWSWRPMVYDVEDFVGLVTDLLAPKKDKGCQVWRKHASLVTKDSAATSVYTPPGNYALTVDTEWEVTHSERVSIHSMIAPPRVMFDPIVTGWELVPFSFVLDKLINVGAALSTLGGRIWHHDAQFAYGTQTTITCTKEHRMTGPGVYSGSYLDSRTYFKQVTTRQPIAPVSELPQLVPRVLQIDNLRYYIELMRTIRGRKTL